MIFQLESNFQVVVVILSLLLSLSLHEWAHAGAAYLMGDHTAQQQGRLSLNPLVHIDIFGFLAILLIGLGWAKPVQIDVRNFKHPLRSEIFVSMAGPFSNLFLASLLLVAYLRSWFPYSLYLGSFSIPIVPILHLIIQLNLILFVFNMLPIPPLDGSHLISAFIPKHMPQARYSFQHYGQISLLVILLLGAVSNYRFLPIAALTEYLVDFLINFLGPGKT